MTLKEFLMLLEQRLYIISKRCSIDLFRLPAKTADSILQNPKVAGTFEFEDEEGRFRWRTSVAAQDTTFFAASRLASEEYKRTFRTGFCTLVCTKAELK